MVTHVIPIGTEGGTYTFTHGLGVTQRGMSTNYSEFVKWESNYPMCVENATHSGVVLTSSEIAGVWLEANVYIAGNTWGSGSSQVFYHGNTTELLDVSRESFSGYDALHQFDLYARSIIARQGIKLVSTHIRNWASVEEPEWKRLVIDFEVEAQPDVALALWDSLSDELGDFLATMRDKSTPDLRDIISITVQWK